MPYNEPIGNGAIWNKVSSKGNEFLSGVLEFSPGGGAPPLKVSFVAFEVDQKNTDKSPDYRVLVNSCGPAPERPPKGAGGYGQQKQQRRPAAPEPENDADQDIPF